MNWITIYGIWFTGYACYALGQMHARGHTHWKNCAAALVIGLLWPVAFSYGIYAAHFKTNSGGSDDARNR